MDPDDPRKQKLFGPLDLLTPDLIYVCVAVAALESAQRDRFFILTMKRLQDICIRNYTSWMEQHDWMRPRKADSFDLRYDVEDLEEFEDKWELIRERLSQQQYSS